MRLRNNPSAVRVMHVRKSLGGVFFLKCAPSRKAG